MAAFLSSPDFSTARFASSAFVAAFSASFTAFSSLLFACSNSAFAFSAAIVVADLFAELKVFTADAVFPATLLPEEGAVRVTLSAFWATEPCAATAAALLMDADGGLLIGGLRPTGDFASSFFSASSDDLRDAAMAALASF